MENKQLEEWFKLHMKHELFVPNSQEQTNSISGQDAVAKACASITLEHMKGVIDYTWGVNYDELVGKTSEEVINLYFESLNKKS